MDQDASKIVTPKDLNIATIEMQGHISGLLDDISLLHNSDDYEQAIKDALEKAPNKFEFLLALLIHTFPDEQPIHDNPELLK